MTNKQTTMSQIKTYCTQRGNEPAKGLALTLKAIEDLVDHGNWNGAAYLIGHAKQPLIKKVLTSVVTGLGKVSTTTKDAKAHQCKCVFTDFVASDVAYSDNAISVLREMVAAGGGWKEARAEFAPPSTKEFDVNKLLASTIKKLEAEGVSRKKFAALIEHYQAT